MNNELAHALMDWDLQAIVRGCSATHHQTDNILSLNYFHLCPHRQEDDPLFKSHQKQKPPLSSLMMNWKSFTNLSTLVPKLQVDPTTLAPLMKSTKYSISNLQIITQKISTIQLHLNVKEGTKKNEEKNKRVVKRVREEEGYNDGWAWRKYGQKPIKGSEYPRSYYRCSSCKGCLARKRVQRSHSDPQVFIVTYTAQHTHPPRSFHHTPTKEQGGVSA
ncbi:WRKY Transcription Factor [Stylosanthes scabra]|uniref:WRKY Transcription Factor n=1 Tax=Stylosanthes scabra TaxID=79078 RepID=A0ABU6U5M2_9FABA|nr:WRKY Transcription Factor [Stylosanthes scabra]